MRRVLPQLPKGANAFHTSVTKIVPIKSIAEDTGMPVLAHTP